MNVPEELVRPEVQLVGEDGNALAILSRMAVALRDGQRARDRPSLLRGGYGG